MRVCLHSMSRRKNDCNSRFHIREILFLVACELEVGLTYRYNRAPRVEGKENAPMSPDSFSCHVLKG